MNNLLTWYFRLKEALETPLFTLEQTPINSWSLLRALFILLCALLCSRLTRRLIERIGSQRMHLQASSYYHLARLAHYLILAIGLAVAISSIGVDLSQLVMLISALGIGIGFGLQTVANNFFSSIVLLCEHRIKYGDYLRLDSGEIGYVTEINFRSTILKNSEGHNIVVPNSWILSNKLIHYGSKPPQPSAEQKPSRTAQKQLRASAIKKILQR